MGQITVYDLMDKNGRFDYGKYREAADNWSKMRTGSVENIMQKAGQETKRLAAFEPGNKDTVTISEEGMRQLREMQEKRQLLEDVDWLDPFEHSQIGVNVTTYIAALAEVGEDINEYKTEKGTKASTMGTAYGVLRAEIESRYADPDYKPAIVVEEDGVTAHLMTKEEELAILDEAYDYIAEGAAVTAKNMAEFQKNFGKGQTWYSPEEAYQRVKEEYESEKRNQDLEKIRQKLEDFRKPEEEIYGTAEWKSFLKYVAVMSGMGK